ncbi:heme biosynthesis HemY N-terminal domain-containing protein [Sinimarinibacterium flocculans]|uniref:HemY protein n=1 Tax=Sinimarinibacterium flocculans TaxID=985250 RepID=A0A318E7M4_9GAMM|nr:heme biosynthesis HemY N-terminal domain-containing protein [Sinimarinibacterium flocculans]PXV65193.1 HemY protein [Sinimarinibacterium flocculans]
MIRTLLIAVVALALGAAAAWYLRDETGYVLVGFRGWVLETSLLGLLLGLAVLVFATWLLLRLLVGSVRLPQSLRTMIDRRRRERAQRSFETGLLHLLEGDWRRAEVELVRRAADHHAAQLNYLGAARAAQRLGAGERRDHYLRLATGLAPDIERAALLTQAELQIERGEFVAARETAERLRQMDIRQPYAVELLAEALHGLGEWEALHLLLQDAAATANLNPSKRRAMLERALGERLRLAEGEARLERVKALWAQTPTDARQWPVVRLQYARSLARLNAQAEAMALASDTLAREWDAGLAELYGQLEPADALGQLAAIEQWLTRYGERPELLIAAGRACLRNRLWGKARSYLDAVVKLAPSAAAYLALARVCEQTQQPEEAQRFYRQGLELAAQ